MSVSEWRNANPACAEIERVAALPQMPSCPRLTDTERETVHRLLAEFSEQRAARVEAHKQRLSSSAQYLGREVAAYRVTLTDAEQRLEALAGQLDETAGVPIVLVPWLEARGLIRDAFAGALR